MGAPTSNLDPNPKDRGPEGTPQPSGTSSENTALTDMGNEFGPNPKYNNKFLYYPENIGGSGQDRIVISQFQYVPGDLNNALTGSLGNREYKFSQISQKNTLGTVTLPMVNNLSETNQTGWGEDSLSTIAAGLMAGGTASAEALSQGNLLSPFGIAGGSLINVLNSAGGERAKQYFTTKAAASIIQKAGIQVNPEAYITRATGAVINTNLELLFNGPKLRSFELAFKMTPRSQGEAKNIRSIIKFFKKGMAPRKGIDNTGTFFLGTPNVFKVVFKSEKTIKSLVEFKTCALVTCTVNYTPDGFYAAYQDSIAGGSQPIAVTLQLGFAELTPVFSDDYDINSDSVGPDRAQFEKETITQTRSSDPGPSRGGTSNGLYQGTGGPPTPTETGGGNPYQGTRGNRNNNPYGV